MTGCSWRSDILGVLELICGFFALASPWIIGTGFIWALGIILMISAALRLVQSLTMPHESMWNLVTGLLYGILGWFLFRDPGISLALTTLIIGWGLLIAAMFKGAVWLQTRLLPAAGWRLFNVFITLILGLMVILGWPESTTWFIGTLIAVELIFSGWTLLMYGFCNRLNSEHRQ